MAGNRFLPVPPRHGRPKPADGPSEEKWAYAPGVMPEDIAAAQAERRQEMASHPQRPIDSFSPTHLVAKRKMQERLERSKGG